MYDSFFGLSELPFQLAPDSRYFFASSRHKRALDCLRFALLQGEGFAVVTGEVGAGKTTLIGHLLATLDRAKFSAATVVTTQLDADDLLRMTAAGFGIDHEGLNKATILSRMQRHFDSIVARGAIPLVIVDEAQNLPLPALEELRMLSNLRVGQRGSVLTVLLGQPEFREKINHSDLTQLRQRVVASYHLGPLGPEEAGEYVRHRLTQAGWKDDPKVDPAAFEMAFQETGGIPRLINLLFNRTLLYLYLEQRHTLTAADVQAVAQDLRSELDDWPSHAAANAAPVRKVRS